MPLIATDVARVCMSVCVLGNGFTGELYKNIFEMLFGGRQTRVIPGNHVGER